MMEVRLDRAVDAWAGRAVESRSAWVSEIPNSVGHIDVPESVLVGRANREDIEGIARGQDASQQR